ncbi:EAL domain-containing protein [Roseateles sp.]|uniref:EAL domain-containing protein n=1 Tax=Roseateles sp. TaxID=1971397 RepID=UPI0031DBB8FC
MWGKRQNRTDAPRGLRWPSRWAWIQLLGLLLVTAAVVGLWMTRLQAGPLGAIDGLAADAQMRWRGAIAPGSTYPIVVVAFDDTSAQRFGAASPSREQLAALVERLRAAGPRLIAIDQPLLEAQPGDDALAAAMRGGTRVLLPLTATAATAASEAGVAAAGAQTRLAEAFTHADGVPRSAKRVDALLAPAEPLRSAAFSLGHWIELRDADGSPRRIAPVAIAGGHVYPSLALRIAGDAMRQPWSEATLRWSRDVRWGSLVVPVDLLTQQTVNAYGPAGTFPTIPFADVVDGRVPEESLHNRIVIVGATTTFTTSGTTSDSATRAGMTAPTISAATTRSVAKLPAMATGGGGSFRPTPFGALSSPERLATVADNILTGRVPSRPLWTGTATLAALCVLPLLCVLLLARGRLWRGVLGVAALTVIGLAGAQWAFEEERLLLPIAWPLLAIAASSAMALLLRALAALMRRRAESRRLRANEERLSLAARGADDGLWDWDVARDRLDVSARWRALMGLEDAPIDGIAGFSQTLEEGVGLAFQAALDAHLAGRSARLHHVLRFSQDGRPRALLVRGRAVFQDDRALRVAGTLTDIADVDRFHGLDAPQARDALHDRATGLPNRALFLELLSQRLATPVPGVPAAVAMLSLDGFRDFLDRHGLAVGEAVLAECAQRLAPRNSRPGRVLARVDVDRFALLFELRVGPEGTLVERVPEWALARIEEPVPYDLLTAEEGGAPSRTGAHRLTACAGWAHTGQANFSPLDLMKAAESALARAQLGGPGRVHLFDAVAARFLPMHRWLQERIAPALAANEFELHYQPLVLLSDRTLLGFEALLRWNQPERGVLMPDAVIPAAEESGHMPALGRWTLIEAALQARRWREIGFRGEVAINVSGADWLASEDFVTAVRDAAQALGGGAEGPSLRLELAERGVTPLSPRAESLRTLTAMGVQATVDDFGAGGASFTALNRLPADSLKIDRGLVARLADDESARDELRGIVALARSLGWRTLAEGVEDESQATMLEDLGVIAAQGSWFSKPLPADEVKRLIQTVPWKKPLAKPKG